MTDDPIDVVLRHEGGFVNHPADKGGPTNFGITQRVYSNYLGRKASLQEIKDMSVDAAREIYERNYFTGPRIHLLPNPPRTLVLDMAIHHGPVTAIKMLQRVVNQAGFGPIANDGVLGPMSRAAIEKAAARMGNTLQNALVEERILYMNDIVSRNPAQKVFLKGWLARANSFRLP